MRGELLRIVVGVVYYELLRALSPALKKLIFQRRLSARVEGEELPGFRVHSGGGRKKEEEKRKHRMREAILAVPSGIKI